MAGGTAEYGRHDNQTSPFWQEPEFYFPRGYGWKPGSRLETVFIARAAWLDRHLRSRFQK